MLCNDSVELNKYLISVTVGVGVVDTVGVATAGAAAVCVACVLVQAVCATYFGRRRCIGWGEVWARWGLNTLEVNISSLSRVCESTI